MFIHPYMLWLWLTICIGISIWQMCWTNGRIDLKKRLGEKGFMYTADNLWNLAGCLWICQDPSFTFKTSNTHTKITYMCLKFPRLVRQLRQRRTKLWNTSTWPSLISEKPGQPNKISNYKDLMDLFSLHCIEKSIWGNTGSKEKAIYEAAGLLKMCSRHCCNTSGGLWVGFIKWHNQSTGIHGIIQKGKFAFLSQDFKVGVCLPCLILQCFQLTALLWSRQIFKCTSILRVSCAPLFAMNIVLKYIFR